MEEIVAGIDIGGTNTTIGLVSESGRVLTKSSIKTTDYKEINEFVETACNLIQEQIKSLHSEQQTIQLKGIGIGAPNANPYKGTIENAPNLIWQGVVPLAALFSERLNTTCKITNDAKAAALGELFFGAARGMKDFIVITLGTGLGSGIVANGSLIYGYDGFAGELGHVIMVPDGRLCGCGRKGCLETYVSATGLVRTYRELNSSDNEAPSARMVAERALAGESAAIETFRRTGEMLGFALANSVAYTSPEAIFLFGGLIRAGELLFKPTREAFEANLLNNYKGHIHIYPSALHEGDAAVLGAASILWNSQN
jgi:glucokinase